MLGKKEAHASHPTLTLSSDITMHCVFSGVAPAHHLGVRMLVTLFPLLSSRYIQTDELTALCEKTHW